LYTREHERHAAGWDSVKERLDTDRLDLERFATV